jgi:hypothetical protein
MTSTSRSLAVLVALSLAAGAAGAQTQPKARRPAATKKAAPPPAPPPEATPEQIEAAKLVYQGGYDCEFKQVVEVAADAVHAAYFDVTFGKKTWLMKPVLSSTGAVRLEDVKGETLVVQIANKSMLMNVKAGQRLVDECVHVRQRELIEEAARRRAIESAAASAPPMPASAAALAASAAAEAAALASSSPK